MIKILDKGDCVGCEACVQICPAKCIVMKEDEHGFLYPSVDIPKCTECGLCEKICQIYQHDETNTRNIIDSYGVINKDKNVLLESSSGGVFWSLAEYILSQDGEVCGAYFDENFEVHHGLGATKEECLKFRKSKYVQSRISNTYKDIKIKLEQGKKILFSGTPCQVAALKLFLRKPYENLYAVDFICHGVPSPKLFRDYISFLQQKGDLDTVIMRCKTKNWEKYGFLYKYSNGKTIIDSRARNVWYRLFFKNICSRESCYRCKFTNLNRAGDVTIADFWGIKDKYPNFYSDDGVSFVCVNSRKGEMLFSNIKEGLQILKCNLEDCNQPHLYRPAQVSPLKDQFWVDYKQMSFLQIAKKYGDYGAFSASKALYRRVITKIKNITGIK